MAKPKIVWYARGGDIMRSGPYETQVEAAASIMQHDWTCAGQHHPYGPCTCKGKPAENAFVWPEEEDEER